MFYNGQGRAEISRLRRRQDRPRAVDLDESSTTRHLVDVGAGGRRGQPPPELGSTSTSTSTPTPPRAWPGPVGSGRSARRWPWPSTSRASISVLFPGQSVQPACSPAPPGLWYGVTESLPGLRPDGRAVRPSKAAGLTLGASGDFQYKGRDLDLEMLTDLGGAPRDGWSEPADDPSSATWPPSTSRATSGRPCLPRPSCSGPGPRPPPPPTAASSAARMTWRPRLTPLRGAPYNDYLLRLLQRPVAREG